MAHQSSGEYPARLEPDAIVEALLELRFETPELSEITIGRLSDTEFWQSYRHSRLPIADIPQPIRDSDPTMRYAPLIEMTRADGLRATKIGGRVLSYHITKTYPGWNVFREEIRSVLNHISATIKQIEFVRIGFRYINAFVPATHGVTGLRDTTLGITLRGEEIVAETNLNYFKPAEDLNVGVRIATPGFVAGPVPLNFSLLFDIDVSTPDSFRSPNVDVIASWIDRAHNAEKAEFFALLSEETIRRLTPKNQE